MNALYLIDASPTETNGVKLKFLSADGEIKEFIDENYKPYFLAASPLTEEENTSSRTLARNGTRNVRVHHITKFNFITSHDKRKRAVEK